MYHGADGSSSTNPCSGCATDFYIGEGGSGNYSGPYPEFSSVWQPPSSLSGTPYVYLYWMLHGPNDPNKPSSYTNSQGCGSFGGAGEGGPGDGGMSTGRSVGALAQRVRDELRGRADARGRPRW